MRIQAERICDTLEEAKPLLFKHWEEIAHYKDIPFDPDYEQYLKLETLGMTRSYSARSEDGILIGYAVFFLRPHIHYKSCLMAYQDILFIDKAHRGIGMFLVRYCDEKLKAEGVQVVSQHVKANANFGPALERLNYELMDLVFVKRLN